MKTRRCATHACASSYVPSTRRAPRRGPRGLQVGGQGACVVGRGEGSEEGAQGFAGGRRGAGGGEPGAGAGSDEQPIEQSIDRLNNACAPPAPPRRPPPAHAAIKVTALGLPLLLERVSTCIGGWVGGRRVDAFCSARLAALAPGVPRPALLRPPHALSRSPPQPAHPRTLLRTRARAHTPPPGAIRALFQRFDANGDGTVTAEEFARTYRALFVDATDDRIDQVRVCCWPCCACVCVSGGGGTRRRVDPLHRTRRQHNAL